MIAISLLDDAIDAMATALAAVALDYYEEDAMLPAASLRKLVDAHARLLYERGRLDNGLDLAEKSETPLTDAHLEEFNGSGRYGLGEWLPATDSEFAKELELALAAANLELADMKDDYLRRHKDACDCADELRAANQRAEQLRGE